jgi:PH (Pleckstrin Homology) domain-containing protein
MSAPAHRDDRADRAGHCCPTESNGGGLIAAPPRASSMLGTLLADHALRNGEVIYLAIKPSLWFILLSSLRFIAAVLIVAIAAAIIDLRFENRHLFYWEAALFVIFGRLTWATLQWMGRLYLLTDQRILRLEGVLHIDVFDCTLRQVARVDVIRSTRERIFGLGTLHITPSNQSLPFAQWQMISRPDDVHARVVDAIERNRRCGGISAAA